MVLEPELAPGPELESELERETFPELAPEPEVRTWNSNRTISDPGPGTGSESRKVNRNRSWHCEREPLRKPELEAERGPEREAELEL